MTLAWLSWRGVEFWPLAAMVSALVAAAVLVFYPPQVRMLRAPWRWILPGLRAAAFAALSFSILRPVLMHEKTAEEEGAIAVLLDQSMSMGVVDHALGSQKSDRAAVIGRLVSLAESLHRIPEGLRSQPAAQLEDDLARLRSLAAEMARAQKEAEFARLSGRDSNPAQGRRDHFLAEFLALARQTQKQALRISGRSNQAFAALTEVPSRREPWINRLDQLLDRAEAAAQGSQDLVDQRLYEINPDVAGQCDQLARMSRLRLCWEVLCGQGGLLRHLDRRFPVIGYAVGDQPAPVTIRAGADLPAVPPIAPQTAVSDLSGGLRQVLQQIGKRPIQAVVLFSDGRQIGGEQAIPTGLLPSAVPVFTVFAASPSVRDLAIDHVELPRAAFVDELLTARIVARSSMPGAKKITGQAELSIDGAAPVQAPVIAGERRLEAQLRAQLHEPGVRRLTLTLPAQAGEVTLLNNQVERVVKVLTQRLKVTLIAGAPNWDYRYVRDALSRAPWIELHEGVVAAGAASLGMSLDQIGAQDLIILSDVPREALTAGQWQAISDVVRVRGGSIVLIPGLSHIEQAASHPLFDLMPYARSAAQRLTWQLWPGQSPFFHLSPAAGAEELDFLQLDDDPDASRRRWDELPGFYRFLSIPDLLPGTRILLEERDSRKPILTERRVGNGRAFFLAMNETWRWRSRVGERDQDRFWLQLVRYAVDEPYAVSSGPLSFDVDRLLIGPQDRALARARLSPADPEVVAPSQMEVEIRRDDEPFGTVALLPSPAGGDGRYLALLPKLPPGEYDLRLTGPSGARTVTELSLRLKVEVSSEQEMANVSGDREFLQRMAEATGGRCLSLDQVQNLPALLAEARKGQPRVSEVPLWSSGYLFILVLACLSAEWALRKRFGLA